MLFKLLKRTDVQTRRYFRFFGRSSRSFERFDQQSLAGAADAGSVGADGICATGTRVLTARGALLEATPLPEPHRKSW